MKYEMMKFQKRKTQLAGMLKLSQLHGRTYAGWPSQRLENDGEEHPWVLSTEDFGSYNAVVSRLALSQEKPIGNYSA